MQLPFVVVNKYCCLAHDQQALCRRWGSYAEICLLDTHLYLQKRMVESAATPAVTRARAAVAMLTVASTLADTERSPPPHSLHRRWCRYIYLYPVDISSVDISSVSADLPTHQEYRPKCPATSP